MFRQLPEKALQTYFDIPARNVYYRAAAYPASKLYTEARILIGDWSEWDELEDGLFLGKIPSATDCKSLIEFVRQAQEKRFSQGEDNDKNKFNEIRPLKLIVSVVDYFELGSIFPLSTMATPKDWAAEGIKQCCLPIQDFGAEVHDECVIKTIYEMRKCILQGGSVYVHCKAGRGRSAMLCAIYLAVFDERYADLDVGEAFSKALEHMKQKRHVNLDQNKEDKAKHVIATIRNLCTENIENQSESSLQKISKGIHGSMKKAMEAEEFENTHPFLMAQANLQKNVDEYLASSAAKIAISEMTYFKEIAIYAAYYDSMVVGKTERCETIRTLFNAICEAKDARWYQESQQPKSPFQELLNARPLISWAQTLSFSLFGSGSSSEVIASSDAGIRKTLVEGFLKELSTHICQKLDCTPQKLSELIYKAPEPLEAEQAKALAPASEPRA